MDDVLVMRAPSALHEGLDIGMPAETYHEPKVSQKAIRQEEELLSRLGPGFPEM